MINSSKRNLGINWHYSITLEHLKRYKPIMERLEAMKEYGINKVRITGGDIFGVNNETGKISDSSYFDFIKPKLLENNIRIIYVMWNIVNQKVAEKYPLVGSDNNEYPLAHGAFPNIFHDKVIEINKEILKNYLSAIEQDYNVVDYFQLGNEQVGFCYPPKGFDWKYLEELLQGVKKRVLVSYDKYSEEKWHKFLINDIDEIFRKKILIENNTKRIEDIKQLKVKPVSEFSPTLLANCFFNSYYFGKFLKDDYSFIKNKYPKMNILTPAIILPHVIGQYIYINDSFNFQGSMAFHNYIYWLKSGKIADYLAINCYTNVFAYIPELDGINDLDIELPIGLTFARDVNRAYKLKGVVITETGANSYNCSEDTQRYILIRSIIQALYYGNVKDIYGFLFCEDPITMPDPEETFFGITRFKFTEPKPAMYGFYFVKKLFEKVKLEDYNLKPFIYVILSRKNMDHGYSAGHPYNIVCNREVNFCLSIDDVLVDGDLDKKAKGVIILDSALVSSAKFVNILNKFANGVVIIPGSIGMYGIDEDFKRENIICKYLGLGKRKFLRKEEVNINIKSSFGDFKEGERYYLKNELNKIGINSTPYILNISKNDFIDLNKIEIIAEFEDGGIAMYKKGNMIITSFPLNLGKIFGSTLFHQKLTNTLGDITNTKNNLEGINNNKRILIYELKNTVIAVNTSDVDYVAKINTNCGYIEMPIRARDFSYVRVIDNSVESFIITAEGRLVVNNKLILDSPSDITTYYDNGKIEIRPYYSYKGNEILNLFINKEEVIPGEDKLSKYYKTKSGLPAIVSYNLVNRFDIKVNLVKKEMLGNEDKKEKEKVSYSTILNAFDMMHDKEKNYNSKGTFGRKIELIEVPDEIDLHIKCSTNKISKIKVEVFEINNFEKSRIFYKEFSFNKTSFKINPTLKPLRPFIIYIHPLDEKGNSILENIKFELFMYYFNRVFPVLFNKQSKLSVAKILYPRKYDGCEILDIKARYYSKGVWEDLVVNKGEKGVIDNHLYYSEAVLRLPS